MKLLIGAGGTGGHIIPAAAIALKMAEKGWRIEFIGNANGMEKAIVAAYGFSFNPINVQKIYRKLTFAHLKFPFLFVQSLLKSLSYIRKIQPEAVLCTGGFVSGPVALAAVLLKKRLYFQDGNSYPGLTTRFMAKYTRHIFTASEAAAKYLPKANCLLTGNPLLPYQKTDLADVDWTELNLTRDSKKLFIIGGSQGSAVINRAVGQIIENLLQKGIEVIWQTGKSHKADIMAKYGQLKGVHIFDFTSKMSFYYQISDMAISRAGALSIAELEEHRIPAVFIPLPTSAENHQYINARNQAKHNKGLVLEQAHMNNETLMEMLNRLQKDYQLFKQSLDAVPPNHAAQQICDTIIDETKSRIDSACCPV